MENAITVLVKKGAVVMCLACHDQFLSSYFLVDKSNGVKRIILNLKTLNVSIDPPHFKLDDVCSVVKLISENFFMGTIDLKDAHFTIPVAPEYRKYLRFSFRGQIYEFTCLPFGLCIAPFVFTKIMKPVA